ncbi:Protein of unknown function [Rhodovulum sp. ES.010]|uniref:DUF2849 domain-containing protein n=1 Tax=Rhodovulum sp. ES.010 TaxID=1882821 RepID=UPI000928A726|nr:DUF2849 domain-containing protein [Rhodovulum sp. ES.010]SIO38442.1 Protein of unknown function [Rhodovulum sp. ES.010]
MPARDATPKVVTANDLLTGDVVYLAGDGAWSRRHVDARLLQDAEAARAALAAAAAQADKVVGAYLAEARPGPDGHPEPVHFREVFRTRGPSNYRHGKQDTGTPRA